MHHKQGHGGSRRLLGLLLLLPLSGRAQQPDSLQQQITITAGNPIPQTTIVAVEQPDEHLVEHTTLIEPGSRHLSRKDRRTLRAQRFAAEVDSLVQSRSFLFVPDAMRCLPDGDLRMLYNGLYFFGLYIDHVEVHLPIERGVTHYVEMENFDTMSIKEYRATPIQTGWNVQFQIPEGEDEYWVDFTISTITGECILTFTTPTTTMRYIGSLKRSLS